jgi:glycosyltransferase involved in cell wall biosynthesis
VNIAFINENTLGHSSHLPRFADQIDAMPDCGIRAIRLNATPLPPALQGAERAIRGLFRFGLDWQWTRWRIAASRHVADQLVQLRQSTRIDALLVNTQSVGLLLPETAPDLPCWVALDATFAQLARSPWFRPTPQAAWFHPITLRWLMRAERRLFHHATGLLPWAAHVAQSLSDEYRISNSRIHVVPPSVPNPTLQPKPLYPPGNRPRILFIGGDFIRKGGPALLEAWRPLRHRCDLDLVTRDEVPEEPGLRVHHGVEAGSDRWRNLWTNADAFVLPSRLETFGIVLIEAQAFGIPVVASDTGAAREILENGEAGTLLPDTRPASIAQALTQLLDSPESSAAKAARARIRFLERYELRSNTRRLISLLKGNPSS